MRRPLVLGSRSPRRRDILAELGIKSEVLPADIDEIPLPGERPVSYVERISRAKLVAVSERVRDAGGSPSSGAFVLVADTLVTFDNRLLGKPEDDVHAFEMLRQLSGRSHEVMTGYAIGSVDEDESGAGERPQDGGLSGQAMGPMVYRLVTTQVWMRKASDKELWAYVRTGECADKAGAYAIQGIGSFLVERIAGSYGAVVGLPAAEVVQDLVRFGVVEPQSAGAAE